jgi:hypothetical protein
VHNTVISKNANNAGVTAGAPSNFVSFCYNRIGGGSASSAFNESGDQTSVTDPGLGRCKTTVVLSTPTRY